MPHNQTGPVVLERVLTNEPSDDRFELDLEVCPATGEAELPRVPGDRYLMIDGEIDGQALRFLIDTGSPTNVLHSGWIEERPSAEIRAMDHPAGGPSTQSRSLRLGAWTAPDNFEAYDLSALAPLGEQGILGAASFPTRSWVAGRAWDARSVIC